ncbi:MAG: hypothetical protein ABIX01_02680 [Chitinophagaceae bacterium]
MDKTIKKNGMKSLNIKRRDFIKASSIFTIGTFMADNSLAKILESKEDIFLLILPDDKLTNTPPVDWAIAELKKALAAKYASLSIINKIEQAGDFCIVLGGLNSEFSQRILKQEKIVAFTNPESLCIAQSKIDGKNILLVTGADKAGLVYSITELADRIKCLKTNRQALEFTEPVIEKPHSKTRSVLRNFSSELEDKVWFYDKKYWIDYFDLLVYSRINRFNFSTGMAYNSVQNITDGYMVFPYPFFVDVPGYQVKAKGLSPEERKKNLEILKFIGTETAKRCIQFQFGIWTLAYDWDQGPVSKRSPDATYKTEGLTGETHPDYCRDALVILLKEVPQISGLTFRVHEESGIAQGSKDFWQVQFSALTNCGRKVEIDMHAKNLEARTLQTAIDTGQPIVVSPKFCGEHLGLPYHQASIRDFEMVDTDKLEDTGKGLLVGNRKFTRYGYADFLSDNRNWNIVYRIWPGTQRFLLSGDPTFFAGYGRIADFCGADGFELCEPLSFKGRRGTGATGGRCGYIDQTLNPRCDFEKYNYFYRTWGRLAYNPVSKAEVWQRSLNYDFGKAADFVKNALAEVTGILPLFYTAHAVSADCATYLPELYRNSFIAKDSDWPNDAAIPKTFGNTSAVDPQLFQSPNQCAESLLNGEITGKYTPVEVAQWLDNMAKSASKNIQEAKAILGLSTRQSKFKRVEEDVLILIGMAHFFAAKFRCGVLWRIYTISGDKVAGEKGIEFYESGRNIWADMAKRALGIYRTDISYGPGGHWNDRIPSFDEDIADLKSQIKCDIIPANTFDITLINRAVEKVISTPQKPIVKVVHQPATHFEHGKCLPISIVVTEKPNKVSLYYRHVNQADRWRTVELIANKLTFSGEIPSGYTDHRFPLQYYFEIELSPTLAVLHPTLVNNLATVPYYTIQAKPKKI